MKLTDEQFERALDIFQEFGPRRRIPIYQRWQEAFPAVVPDDMREWETHFHEIEHFAFGVAEQFLCGQLDESAVPQRISERFPRLSPVQVRRTASQAMSFASK